MQIVCGVHICQLSLAQFIKDFGITIVLLNIKALQACMIPRHANLI